MPCQISRLPSQHAHEDDAFYQSLCLIVVHALAGKIHHPGIRQSQYSQPGFSHLPRRTIAPVSMTVAAAIACRIALPCLAHPERFQSDLELHIDQTWAPIMLGNEA